MSDMFRGFYTEPPTYIPDNMHERRKLPKTVSLIGDSLDVILDKHGHKKGYSWNYGETVSIPISIRQQVRVEMDAYCFSLHGKEPDINTVGRIGQKFYNLKDVRSWIMTSYVPDTRSYIWTEEPKFTFPENGEKLVEVCPDMRGKYILVELIDFRGEQIFERVFFDADTIHWTLNIEESLALQRGIYDMYIYVGDEEAQYKKLTKRYEIVIR